METYMKAFEVESKNPSEEAIRRWREAIAPHKNLRRRFRSVSYLAKRNEAEKKKRQIQEKIRVALYVQKEALRFIDAGAGDRSNKKPRQDEYKLSEDARTAVLNLTPTGCTTSEADAGNRSNEKKNKLQIQATWVEWAFLLTALCLEILSIAFDQASSPSKPQYALFGMILAIAAVLVCIWELIYKGKKERVILRPWGRLWWFYYPHPQHRPFGTVLDFYGLVGGISQCICSTVQYICFRRHADNPIRASLWPAIFLICLGAKRLNDNRNEICDEHGY